jgi:hypothetical protein
MAPLDIIESNPQGGLEILKSKPIFDHIPKMDGVAAFK